MATKTRVSLAQYLAMEECKPHLELIDGEVVQKSMPSYSHATLVSELVTELNNYVRRTHEARVTTEMRHLQRDDAWVFLPDIAVTLKTRLFASPSQLRGPVEVLPDLAVEVLSPDDQPGRLSQRIAHYMASGVRLLWVIDPETERVTVWEPGKTPRDLAAPAVLTAAPVLAGFDLDLAALFPRLHE